MTGVLEDDLSVTALLHKYGALAFWDYASAAPYVNIDMNPQVPEAGRLYALNIFVSFFTMKDDSYGRMKIVLKVRFHLNT